MTTLHARGWPNGSRYYENNRCDVVAVRQARLRPVSSEGIRQDVVAMIFLLVLAILVTFLLADLSALVTGSHNISRLREDIARADRANGLLREEMSLSTSRMHYLSDPYSKNLVAVGSVPLVRITVPGD